MGDSCGRLAVLCALIIAVVIGAACFIIYKNTRKMRAAIAAAKAREEAARAAMETAKRADEAKTRFLANMSHDIRTPMNAIMNMSGFALENANEPEKHAEYLSTIYEASEHLLHLINDVLDMSRIESGQTIVACEPFDIKEELMRQVEAIKPLCMAKKQTLLVDLDGVASRTVRGDALKVSQIVMNLLSNAAKFTPEGGAVRFTAAELPARLEDIVDIRFTVEDNGIGISAENKQRIFEPFSRAADQRVGMTEGTGLGLSICKSYVEAMGGSLACESEEGDGSTFTVELFFARADESRQEDKEALAAYGETPFMGMRCLVVEDNAINRKIAEKLLSRLGFLVDMADDGGAGVRMFLDAPPDTYDVIYMDVQMPVADGYEATAAIRKSAHPQANSIVILAMSANVFVEDIEKARLVGMDGYIRKPIVFRELVEETYQAVQKKKAQHGDAQP